MKLVFGVVVCILIKAENSIASAQENTTINPGSTTISTTTQGAPDICTGLDPPVNQSISVNKTSAHVIWSTIQSNPNCVPSTVFVDCIALWEENTEQWVRNRSANGTVDAQNNISSVQIEGLTEFTNYTCNAMILANDSNSSSSTEIKFTTLEEVSSPPLNLTIVETTSTNFTIRWKKPEKNPGVFISYLVHVTSSGPNHFIPSNCSSHSYNELVNTMDEQHQFLGASPDYLYHVSIWVRNSAGNGSQASINVSTHTAASEAITQFTLGNLVLDVEANTITQNISWDMPCQPNGYVHQFQIELDGYYIPNSTAQHKITIMVNATDSDTVTKEIELMPAFEYFIGIRANGLNETGEFYNATFATDDNFPGIPILENITDIGSEYFVLSWKEPTRNAGFITNYTIQVDSLGPLYNIDPDRCQPNKEHFNVTLPGYEVTYNFTNGSPYYMYNISLVASTSRGTGNLTELTTITNSSVPKKPDNLTFELYNENRTGMISWLVPCDSNGPIDDFFIILKGNYSEDNSPVLYNYSVSYENGRLDYNYSVPLRESYNYELSVWIILQDGTPGEMDSKNLTTPDGYPGPPNITSIVNVGSKSFTILWDPPSYRNGRIIEYQINITSLGPLYETHCDIDNIGNHVNITYGNTRVFNFTEGSPYYNYTVIIVARTSRGLGSISNIESITTTTSIPENVRNISSTISNPTLEEYNAYINISFEQPCRTNGPLLNYKLTLAGRRQNNVDDDSVRISDGNPYVYVPLKPEYDYEFTIETNNVDFTNSTSSMNFRAPSGIPQFSELIIEDMDIETGTSSATIVLRKDDFDSSNGNIIYMALILAERNETGGDSSRWEYPDWPTVNSNGFYQITRDWWNPFDNNVKNVTFTIGNETKCENENYCNKPLANNRAYYLIIRAFTERFYKNSPTIYFHTEDTSKLGVILGVIFGILGLALLGVAGFFVWRKNMMRIPPLLYTRKASSVRAPPDANTCIPINKFVQYCKNLENNPEKFTEQYMLLSEKSREIESTHTTAFAELTENRRKNRYTNILPFDATRVKLLIDEDDEIGSDYINASYIKGYSGKTEYIATQGPLPTTCRDFWKMVIQENVSIIVMVTQFVEDNKEKCFKYFPNNHQCMTIGDDMEVRCTMELHFGTYCVRTIEVKKDSTQVTVTHMQYLDWPDFNVPKGTDTMLQFCHQLRERLKIEGGCVIVHCSAGVGRTGTLIATDILIQSIKAGKNIDIFNTVLELRKQRKLMVQAQKQYVYIHTLIRDTIEQSNSSAIYENLEPLYENQSSLQLKTDDDNLINRGKEKESQF